MTDTNSSLLCWWLLSICKMTRSFIWFSVRKFHNLLHKFSLWAKVSTTRLIQTSLRLSLCLSIAIREKLLSQLHNVSLGTIIGFLYRIVYWIDSKICWKPICWHPEQTRKHLKLYRADHFLSNIMLMSSYNLVQSFVFGIHKDKNHSWLYIIKTEVNLDVGRKKK